MCIKVVEEDPWQLNDVPGKFKTQEMWEEAVEDEQETLEYIHNHFKTQEIREKAVEKIHGC